jgi:predicted aminopeptidase
MAAFVMIGFRYKLFLLAGLLLLNGCNESGYLWQCAVGQWTLMSRARSIDEILDQGTEPQAVRDQLVKVVKMRDFAVKSLHLPDSGSYHKYADLERPFAVWNLVAAPELSLELQQWCFPIAGCVSYRGYFDEASARAAENDFIARGFDTDVYGVQAYSTLNWFDDPVLNTFLTNDDIRLAALLFHEMAHQIIYIQNDSTFNESFAKTVEMEGVRRWLQQSGTDDLWQAYLVREDRSANFHRLLTKARGDLAEIYKSNLDDDIKREAKENRLKQAFQDYEELKISWNGYKGFDAWMQRGLNNARLASVATYYDYVPAFQALMQQSDGNLETFYGEVKILGTLSEEERFAKLKSLPSSLKFAITQPE